MLCIIYSKAEKMRLFFYQTINQISQLLTSVLDDHEVSSSVIRILNCINYNVRSPVRVLCQTQMTRMFYILDDKVKYSGS